MVLSYTHLKHSLIYGKLNQGVRPSIIWHFRVCLYCISSQGEWCIIINVKKYVWAISPSRWKNWPQTLWSWQHRKKRTRWFIIIYLCFIIMGHLTHTYTYYYWFYHQSLKSWAVQLELSCWSCLRFFVITNEKADGEMWRINIVDKTWLSPTLQ